MTGRKLAKKSLNFGGEKVWNELLCKYIIYAPNVKTNPCIKTGFGD